MEEQNNNTIQITTNNLENLIRQKQINFNDLKNHLNLVKVENIYYEMIIKSYFGYDKYIELKEYFNNNSS